MKVIEWDDSLSVGVQLIDEQHKVLIQRLNDMSEAVEENRGTDKIAKTLDFLIDYTNFHFSAEAKHMETNNYPGFDDHVEKHKGFTTPLNELVSDFKEEGATPILAEAIDTFLVKWLVEHIMTVDVEFGKFLKDKGIEIS